MSLERHGIEVDQVWLRRSTGREVHVTGVYDKYIRIDDGRAITYPWIKSFLKAYTKEEADE